MQEKVHHSKHSISPAANADVITEALQRESLLKTGALQNAILNSANFSSIATDEKGVIQIFNVGAERMLGYAAADVVNKITPANISDPQEVIARAKALSVELETPIAPGFEALVFKASRGIEDIYELTYIRKDGSRFPAVVSVTALRDAQNTIIGYLLIGTDNTARKQAEEALVKAGALQRAIFNSANFSSIATDAKGVIQIFNVGAERMLGYAADEVMNKITPADISDPQELLARAKNLSSELGTQIDPGFDALVFKASHGIEDIYELTYIRKDGSRFPAVVSVTALRDEQNSIIGFLLIGTDNTARKLEKEILRESEERYRSLFNSIDEGFCLLEMIYDEQEWPIDWRYLEVNPSFEKQTGLHDIVGKRIRELAPDHEEHWFETYGMVVLTGMPVRFVNEAKAIDRIDARWFDLYAFRVGGADSRKVAVIFTDITERKRLDQVLLDKNIELERAKYEAEKANLAKSDFLSSMSHELRTPLNAILGFAQLLEVSTPPPAPSQVLRLQQILKAGWYLLDLINEILDLTLIESGKLSLSLEPVSLIDLIHECKAMIEPQAEQRDIKLTFSQCDFPYFVLADQTRLKQVLINLLTNAIKYNREHGTVALKCSADSLKSIYISIKDSGEGLPPEKIEQLFQPFNRLGQEYGIEEGTGIGLVVTKQLVELMGGSIGVKSTLGVGSEFWIELIRAKEPQHGAEDAASAELVQKALEHSQRTRSQRSLLYVEDNPANLMLVEQIIADQPSISLLSARDGNLGIALARIHLPDVILMDINLPGINGFEVLKILRSDMATMHIPVVALSANAMPRDIEKGLEAGFFGYLTKPVKINELLDVLYAALKSSSAGLDVRGNTEALDD